MSNKPLKILIIEDMQNMATLFRNLLSNSPYDFETSHVSTAKAGLRVLGTSHFDAVTLDYNLPDLNGLKMLQKMRELKIDIPVVMITGEGDELLAANAIRAGAQDYLIKDQPYVKMLPKTLKRAIHEHQLSKQLEQSKKRYWDLFQNANVAIMVLDAKTLAIQQMNRHAAQLLDMTFPLKNKKTIYFHSIYPESEQASFKRLFSQVKLNSKATLEQVYLYRQDRSLLATEINASRVKSGDQQHIELFINDVTEKLKMQRRIQLSAERLNSVFNGITDMICVIDHDYKLRMTNKRYNQVTNLDVNDLHRSKCYETFFGRKLPCDNCQARKTFTTGKTKFVEINHENRVYHIWTFPMNDSKTKTDFIVEYVKDMTEQKEIERQLIKAEKLASIGLLSSGIAHELRNPLNIIETTRYNIQMALKNRDQELDKKLEVIKNNVDRASGIINNLLQFSKHSGAARETIDIENLIKSTVSLLDKEMLHNNVKCMTDFKNVSPVEFNLDSLKQVFLNIIMNAVQAMPEGGELKITTTTSTDRKWVLVDFRDTGVGISEENLKNIYTPFFTTKGTSGTGLGLYLSYTIMKREGGDIFVRSQEGFGTIFTIKIPASTVPLGSEKA